MGTQGNPGLSLERALKSVIKRFGGPVSVLATFGSVCRTISHSGNWQNLPKVLSFEHGTWRMSDNGDFGKCRRTGPLQGFGRIGSRGTSAGGAGSVSRITSGPTRRTAGRTRDPAPNRGRKRRETVSPQPHGAATPRRRLANGQAAIARYAKPEHRAGDGGFLYPGRNNDGHSMSAATEKMIEAAALLAAFAYFGAVIAGFVH